jgi:hypothetical protein
MGLIAGQWRDVPDLDHRLGMNEPGGGRKGGTYRNRSSDLRRFQGLRHRVLQRNEYSTAS